MYSSICTNISLDDHFFQLIRKDGMWSHDSYQKLIEQLLQLKQELQGERKRELAYHLWQNSLFIKSWLLKKHNSKPSLPRYYDKAHDLLWDISCWYCLDAGKINGQEQLQSRLKEINELYHKEN